MKDFFFPIFFLFFFFFYEKRAKREFLQKKKSRVEEPRTKKRPRRSRGFFVFEATTREIFFAKARGLSVFYLLIVQGVFLVAEVMGKARREKKSLTFLAA